MKYKEEATNNIEKNKLVFDCQKKGVFVVLSVVINYLFYRVLYFFFLGNETGNVRELLAQTASVRELSKCKQSRTRREIQGQGYFHKFTSKRFG